MKSIIGAGLLLVACWLSDYNSNAGSTISTSSSPQQTRKMKTQVKENYILLVYLPKGYGPEQAKEVRKQWETLLQQWKADSTYVTSFVYPGEAQLVSGLSSDIQSGSMLADSMRLTSNMIVRAADMEEATLLARMCPVLRQGGTIEVRPVQSSQSAGPRP
jgi:exonuclease III